jgi:HNH endonuclease
MIEQERFWTKVQKTNEGCWLWMTGLNKHGYGQFACGLGSGRNKGAHVYSWELANGPVPKGKILHHLCQTRRCVKPDHLMPVSYSENNRRERGGHCAAGTHLWIPENIYVTRRGSPVCRACNRERMQRARVA